MTLGLHHAQLMLHAQQRAEDVGIEDGRVALGGMFYNRTGLAFGSGSVYRHIKATEACHGLIDEVSYVVLVPYIRIHEFRLRPRVRAAQSPNFGRLHHVDQRQRCARPLFREGQGGGSSNARKGASDQNNRGLIMPRRRFERSQNAAE
jgi:hypothetical protein